MIKAHHTAVIADDEPFMREALSEQLQMPWPDLDIVAEASDGPDALRALTMHKPSFAFFGYPYAGLVRAAVGPTGRGAGKGGFVTAHDSHAWQAFDARAIDYVLKPLDAARLAKMVTRLQSMDKAPPPNQQDGLRSSATGNPSPSGAHLEWLHVSERQQVRLTHVDDVMFFESDTNYTCVVSAEVDGLIRTSLKELLEKLPPAFVQIHRSAVVNRRYVRAVHRIDDNVELEIKDHASRLKVRKANRHLFKAM